MLRLFQGLRRVDVPFGIPFFQVQLPLPVWADGTFALLVSFLLVNLLVLMEVADRLSLKGELEVAREIQLAMLPRGTYGERRYRESPARPAPRTRSAAISTTSCRFADGQVILTLGDVAGKGSPAALLMALLLAVLRTLVDERLEPAALVERLNVQISRHSPASRFITLFYAIYDPATGALRYVNAGQNPPLRPAHIRHATSGSGRPASRSACSSTRPSTQGMTTIRPGDLLVLYSDGITEAEDPAGQPLEETGLEHALELHAGASAAELGGRVLGDVEAHARPAAIHDDLTVLILKRAAGPTV